MLINLVNNLDYKKYDITVLTLSKSDSTFLNPNIKYKHIFSNFSRVIGKIENKIKLFLNYKLLSKIYCRGYDIAIAFKMGESSRIVGYSNAHKKYCWIHSNVSEIDEPYSYSFDTLEEEKIFLHVFDELIAVSKKCEDSFNLKYGNNYKIRVIYKLIDIKKINRLAKEELPEDDKYLFNDGVPVIGTVGRIDYQKGIDKLIYITENLKNKNFNFKMVIIGDGIDYDKYLNIVKEKELPIHMIGFRNNPYSYVKHFQLFVCSSIS